MDVDQLRREYHSLVVTACEWRALGLYDPNELAELAFGAMRPGREYDLRDLYQAITKAVMTSFQRRAEQQGILEWLRSGATLQRPGFGPTEEPLRALSHLREAERELLQYRYWDDLTIPEIAVVRRRSPERVEELLERALQRYAGKLRSTPVTTRTEVEQLISGLKPGEHRRFPASD